MRGYLHPTSAFTDKVWLQYVVRQNIDGVHKHNYHIDYPISNSYLHTVHVVPNNNAQKPCLPHQQDIIPYVVKISVLGSWRWANVCPKHVELILEINKTVIVASSWCPILLYLHWWCTVKNKSNILYQLKL
jgi:hypothetical protein